MARFVNAQVPEVVRPFWAAIQAGALIADAAAEAGTYRKQGTRLVAACGGVPPRRGRHLRGRCLSFAEREQIALARARGASMRAIARRLGHSPSTISRGSCAATATDAAAATGRRPPTRWPASAPVAPSRPNSTETIYRSLHVQSRGALRRELARYLRTGRTLRKPGRQPGQRKNRIPT